MNLKSKIVIGTLCLSVFAYAAVKGDQAPYATFGQITSPSYDGGVGGSILVPSLPNSNAIAVANEGSAKVYVGFDAGVSPSTGFPVAAGTQLCIDVVQVTQVDSNLAPRLYVTTASGSTSDVRFIRVK